MRKIFILMTLFPLLLMASEQSTVWLKARQNGVQAREAFDRAHRFALGWIAYQNQTTKLLPERTADDRQKWTIHNAAADLYPRMLLAGYFTDHTLYNERLLPILQTERELTNRLGVLPDGVYIDTGEFIHDEIDTTRIIFGASEYCKDGLLMLTEVMGEGPWYDRMVELEEAIWQLARFNTPFGKIPVNDSEVNGEQLMVLTRLFTKTGDVKYLEWARRIGDTYLLHIMPKNNGLPAHKWDFEADTSLTKTFRLSDHGNEILGGLALLFAVESELGSERADSYKEPLKTALDIILENGRNEDGLFYSQIDEKTALPATDQLTDTWGYVYTAFMAYYKVEGEKKYRRAVEQVLNNIGTYRGYDWPGDVDGLADCLEGALYLMNRLSVKSAWTWMDAEVKRLFQRQQPVGIITGVYNADNSFARAALMYARAKTAGVYPDPWNRDLELGAVEEENVLFLNLRSSIGWSGKLKFDPKRHETVWNLGRNYARLNEFQEWFTVDSLDTFLVAGLYDSVITRTGAELTEGLEVALKSADELQITVSKKPPKSMLRQYRLYISSEDSLELYSRDVWSKEYLGPGRFIADGLPYDSVLFRFRGHCYGRGGCKGEKPNKSFKVKFPKNNKLDGTTSNLDINVIWQYTDNQGGVYRSKLPMDLFALAGYPAPKTGWCEFYLNDVYMGLFMEQEELDSGPFLEEWFGDESGNMYKFDKVSVDSLGHRRFWREINVEENVDWSDFEQLMLAYEIKDSSQFYQTFEQLVNVDKFLEHAALNMLASVSDLYNYGRKKSWDTLRTHELFENPMLYHERYSDRFVLLPWDANSALANPNMDIFPKPWSRSHGLGYVLSNPEWKEKYITLLKSYLSTVFTVDNMQLLIDDIYQDTREALVRHNDRWQDIYGFYDLEYEKLQMEEFVEDRIAYIKSLIWQLEHPQTEPLPFNVIWEINPPLRNGSDFKATTDWGFGKKYLLDRDYVFLEKSPILTDGIMIQTYNNMKRDSLVAEEDRDIWTCTVIADTPVVAYLLWDPRTFPYTPKWMSSEKWAYTGAFQPTTDNPMGGFDILRGYFAAHEPIVLGHHQTTDLPLGYRAPSFWVLILTPTKDEEFPQNNSMFQNYPNPFHSKTVLRFSLLDPVKIDIEIFNVMGQRVRHLISKELPTGFYEEIWDGRDDSGRMLPSGVYWAQLKMNGIFVTKIKMALLR